LKCIVCGKRLAEERPCPLQTGFTGRPATSAARSATARSHSRARRTISEYRRKPAMGYRKVTAAEQIYYTSSNGPPDRRPAK
jgi:hypothetical protein